MANVYAVANARKSHCNKIRHALFIFPGGHLLFSARLQFSQSDWTVTRNFLAHPRPEMVEHFVDPDRRHYFLGKSLDISSLAIEVPRVHPEKDLKMKAIKRLEQVLGYRNDQLILMFSRKKGIPLSESSQLFEELKKWLWFLAQRNPHAKPFAVFPEQSIIDEYWHEFILSTKDYHAFCYSFFDRYIHHVPTPNGILEDGSNFGAHVSLIASNETEFISSKLNILKESMEEVTAALGRETVRLWYREFPKRYFYKFNETP